MLQNMGLSPLLVSVITKALLSSRFLFHGVTMKTKRHEDHASMLQRLIFCNLYFIVNYNKVIINTGQRFKNRRSFNKKDYTKNIQNVSDYRYINYISRTIIIEIIIINRRIYRDWNLSIITVQFIATKLRQNKL